MEMTFQELEINQMFKCQGYRFIKVSYDTAIQYRPGAPSNGSLHDFKPEDQVEI